MQKSIIQMRRCDRGEELEIYDMLQAKFSSDTHLGNGQVNLMVSTSLGEMDGVISPEPLY